ncbi:MAG: 16S rRNA (guanine(527)-N(7))-methyltransferase RsmG [Chthonomonadales bacterium]
MQPHERKLLEQGAFELGAPLDGAQLDQFERFAYLLYEANKGLNLTRIPPEQAVPLHFLDSLAVCRALNVRMLRNLADVGSGAGFPGIPLKIAFPHLEVTLIEATQKKAAFLREVVRQLGLSAVEVLAARAEDLVRDPLAAGGFDAATARAVARLTKLLEWMLPLVRSGGSVVALKSRTADEELLEVRPLLPRLGAVLAKDVQTAIPGTDAYRRILVFERTTKGRRR